MPPNLFELITNIADSGGSAIQRGGDAGLKESEVEDTSKGWADELGHHVPPGYIEVAFDLFRVQVLTLVGLVNDLRFLLVSPKFPWHELEFAVFVAV